MKIISGLLLTAHRGDCWLLALLGLTVAFCTVWTSNVVSKAKSMEGELKLFYWNVKEEKWRRCNSEGKHVNSIVEVKGVLDRIMTFKLEVEGVILNVDSVYASEAGHQLEVRPATMYGWRQQDSQKDRSFLSHN